MSSRHADIHTGIADRGWVVCHWHGGGIKNCVSIWYIFWVSGYRGKLEEDQTLSPVLEGTDHCGRPFIFSQLGAFPLPCLQGMRTDIMTKFGVFQISFSARTGPFTWHDQDHGVWSASFWGHRFLQTAGRLKFGSWLRHINSCGPHAPRQEVPSSPSPDLWAYALGTGSK